MTADHWEPLKVLKPLNGLQSDIFFNFREFKHHIHFKLSFVNFYEGGVDVHRLIFKCYPLQACHAIFLPRSDSFPFLCACPDHGCGGSRFIYFTLFA